MYWKEGDVSFVFIFGFRSFFLLWSVCISELGTAAAGGEYDSIANDDVCKGNFDGKKSTHVTYTKPSSEKTNEQKRGRSFIKMAESERSILISLNVLLHLRIAFQVFRCCRCCCCSLRGNFTFCRLDFEIGVVIFSLCPVRRIFSYKFFFLLRHFNFV